MKKAKIKLMGADMYISAIEINMYGELNAILAFFEHQEAVFELEKAKKYCELLNNDNPDSHFIYEEIEEDE